MKSLDFFCPFNKNRRRTNLFVKESVARLVLIKCNWIYLFSQPTSSRWVPFQKISFSQIPHKFRLKLQKKRNKRKERIIRLNLIKPERTPEQLLEIIRAIITNFPIQQKLNAREKKRVVHKLSFLIRWKNTVGCSPKMRSEPDRTKNSPTKFSGKHSCK